MSGALCRISLARADIALAALLVAVSADASALALATAGGMVDGADELSASSAAAAVMHDVV